MNKGMTFITGIGLGAGLGYLFDPKQGSRRRGEINDTLSKILNKTAETMENSSRGIKKMKPRGGSGAGLSLVQKNVAETTLAERIEAKLRSVVPQPNSLTILVSQGRVTLVGPILSQDVDPLLSAVSSEPGVTDVENRLHIDQEIDDPASAGGATLGSRVGKGGPKRSTLGRMIVGATGFALAWYGMRRQGGIANALGAIGLGLLSRGLDNAPVTGVRGSDSPRHVVDVRRSIQVAAPPAQVFQFWANAENFPHFMSFIQEVKKVEEGRFHWKIVGRGGGAVGMGHGGH